VAVITSAANPRLKLVRKLASARQRQKLGLFAVEGEDLVEAVWKTTVSACSLRSASTAGSSST